MSVELEKALISKCIEHFSNLNGERNSFNDVDKYGHIPDVLFIEYCDAVRRTEHHYNLISKKRWKYENSIVIELAIENELEKKDISIDGMFYAVASAKIYWDLEKKKGFLDIVFGPRFGRGFSYDIHFNEEKLSLENEYIEWVS